MCQALWSIKDMLCKSVVLQTMTQAYVKAALLRASWRRKGSNLEGLPWWFRQ